MRYTFITVLFVMLIFFAQSGEAFRCGTPHLKMDMPPELLTNVATAPAHPAAPALSIGFQRTFFAIDFARKQQYTINATLRASGSHCYIFVEDSEWQENVTARTVQTIQTAFETATPADPRRGIYDILTESLGPPPDIDRNQKVILLLLNIRDINTHHTTAGYFLPIDQNRGMLHHPTLGPLHSNEADILYIHSKSNPANSNELQAVIAHEFQHLIHWKHSPNEETWIDEGCADYAAFQCGYDLYQHLNAFQKTPNISLTDWSQMSQTNLLAHYGASFLFMLYLHDHYGGIQTIAALVKNPLDGILGITRTLQTRGTSRTFSDIFADWKVTNYLTTWRVLGTLEKPFGYHTLAPVIQPLFTHDTYPVLGKNKKLANFAAHAIEYKVATADQAGLNFSFSTQRNANVNIKVAYLFNTGEILVETLPFKTTDGTASLDIPTFGNDVQRVMLMPSLQVENQRFSQQSITYNYNAFEGNLGTYATYILPNPIHPNYWEIIAVPSEAKGVHSLTLTLTYQNSKILDAKPMLYVENKGNTLYRCAFHLKSEIETATVEWSIRRGDTIIDEGVLNEPITDN
ncbi:MAG: hypothetical protein OXI43_01510 [Candidatus Poribacteria bacterium]|nr:hypothetical protein [Candidatus Poribacteria bacterium]